MPGFGNRHTPYTADGRKLRERIKQPGQSDVKGDYPLGGLYYRDNQLVYISTAEGRVLQTDASIDINTGKVLKDFRYEYYLKDHLGNIRFLFTDTDTDGVPEILQEDAYDPWGIRLAGLSYTQGEKNRFLYNEKEQVKGLGWYDYGARMYDPATGRWNGVDGLAEKYIGISPYVYCADNPVLFLDVDGREIVPMDENAVKLIKYSVNPIESQFIKVNEAGFIDKTALSEASKNIDNLSENFISLQTIVNSERILEVHVSDSYTTEKGIQEMGIIKYSCLVDEEWEKITNKDELLQSGYSKEMFAENYPEGDRIKNFEGLVGHTDYFDEDAGTGKSLNNRDIVTVNKALMDFGNVGAKQATKTYSHEAYGHYLYKLLNKPHSHPDANVEYQIKQRENEAEEHFNKHPNH